jgi:perosamine synthetase
MTETAVRSVPFARPWIVDSDRAAVQRVLEGHILTHGPECKAFEAEFAAFMGGGAHAVTVSSCMAALHLACLHVGFTPGDEVIVPAETHVATAHAVEWVGATPVFVDPEPATGNLTADRIAAAVTPRTRGIIVVHFDGIPCDMPRIVEVADAHRLRVIEDCALAVGGRWGGRHVGLFGDAGCFSFYPVKHITTAEGGMFVTRHADVAAQVARLRAFGVDRTHAERSAPGMYEVPSLGLNYRMSEMQAALGRSQLARIDDNLRRRAANFARLARACAQPGLVDILDGHDAACANSHYCLAVLLRGPLAGRRDEVARALNDAGVGTSVYYPQPVPRMAYYRSKYGYDASRYPVAEAISDSSIALPVGPHLSDEDVEYVGETVAAVVRGVLG